MVMESSSFSDVDDSCIVDNKYVDIVVFLVLCYDVLLIIINMVLLFEIISVENYNFAKSFSETK